MSAPDIIPTPLTDAAVIEIAGRNAVDPNFARDLERANAALRAEVVRLDSEKPWLTEANTTIANLKAEVERLMPYVSKAILTKEGTMLCSPMVGTKFNEMQQRAERAERYAQILVDYMDPIGLQKAQHELKTYDAARAALAKESK